MKQTPNLSVLYLWISSLQNFKKELYGVAISPIQSILLQQPNWTMTTGDRELLLTGNPRNGGTKLELWIKGNEHHGA